MRKESILFALMDVMFSYVLLSNFYNRNKTFSFMLVHEALMKHTHTDMNILLFFIYMRDVVWMRTITHSLVYLNN